ncbi:unnamed protein product [Periconia digitata]|uniref:Uncharacterized protein n=1 Tax=Periconia digitata TaxID=1303443 RepID=A0A9W4UKK7_9PLEO|nr:unnamed protein product [Periconia digitata]
MSASDTPRSDGFFTFRRALPEDIPGLRLLLTALFESDKFGRDLSFSECEMEDYLDWFLPKALVDCSIILYVLQFLPTSSSRTYKPKVIGCCYVSVSDSSIVPKRIQSLGFMKLHVVNALSDFQVWPNRQAAEVHRKFQRARETRAAMRSRDDATGTSALVLLAAIQPKYRGVGLGTKMVSWAKEAISALGVDTMYHMGSPREVEFMRQCKIKSIVMSEF